MNPNDVLAISEPVEQMYMDCTSQLIINLCSHLQNGSETTAMWEIRKLSELDALTEESIEIIAANTGQSKEVIQRAVSEAVKLEIADAEQVLGGAARAGLIQGAETSLATSPAVASVVMSLTAQAYEDSNIVNTVMLDSTRQRYIWAVQTASSEAAIIEELQGASDLVTLERQLAKTQKALNSATFGVASGTEARTTALRRVIGQLATEGITGYIDRAGHHWSPEAYINMDIRTTVHNAAVQAQKSRSAEYGVSTFQISSHIGARPLCAPYQGKFYSWDNTSGVLEDLNGKKYHYSGINTTSYGEPAGVFGINCGHTPQTFVNGYSLARYEPTADAAENERIYKLTQKQRYYERQIRNNKTKALSYQAADDKVGFERAASYIKAENARYKQWCAANGLTPRPDRLQVNGFNKSVSGKVNSVKKVATLPEVKAAGVPSASKPVPAAAVMKPKSAPKPPQPAGLGKPNSATEEYVSGEGMWINNYLRGKEGMGQLSQQERQYLADLDLAAGGTIGERTLYRSVDASSIFGNMSALEYDNLRARIIYGDTSRAVTASTDRFMTVEGKLITEKGFMSTTKDAMVAEDWGDFSGSEKPIVLNIKTAKTTKGVDLSGYDRNVAEEDAQKEVLLARNQQYEVGKVYKKNGNIYVDVKMQ